MTSDIRSITAITGISAKKWNKETKIPEMRIGKTNYFGCFKPFNDINNSHSHTSNGNAPTTMHHYPVISTVSRCKYTK